MEKFLERCAATESCFHVMPPLEFIAFAQLPTEQHHPAISERREIDQAPLKVLQLHTQAFQFRHLRSEIRQNDGVERPAFHSPAAQFRPFGSRPCFAAKSPKAPPKTLDPLQNRAHGGQQRICFFDSEQLHIRVSSAGSVLVCDANKIRRLAKLLGLILNRRLQDDS